MSHFFKHSNGTVFNLDAIIFCKREPLLGLHLFTAGGVVSLNLKDSDEIEAEINRLCAERRDHAVSPLRPLLNLPD